MIREATERDAEEIERTLLYPSYRGSEEIDPTSNELALDGPEDADCGRWLDHDDRALFVAEPDGRLAGYVSAVIHDAPPIYERGSLANIDGLYVLPERRRRGIATRLLERVETWARDRGCERVGVTAHVANEPARRLYEDRYDRTYLSYRARLD